MKKFNISFEKNGNVFVIISIFILSIVLCIVIAVYILQYVQFNSEIFEIKDNLFSIVQNSILAYDLEKLSYGVYDVDKVKLKEIVLSILNEDYLNKYTNIKNIKIESIDVYLNKIDCINHTSGNLEEPFIHIEMKIEFISILKSINTSFNIHDDIKLALLRIV